MARKRARIIPKSRGNARPTSPRGPQGPSRGRPAPRGRGPQGPSRGRPAPRGRGRPTAPRGRGRPTSPRGPQGRKAPGAVSSMQDLLRKQKEIGGVIRGGSRGPRGPQGPQGPRSGATSRPTINPGQQLRNFMNTMPRAPRAGGPQGPRGPRSGIQLANQNAMQRQMEAALSSQAGRGSMFGTMGNVAQRPIPNRDGRMAQMQADLAREAARVNMAAARQRPLGISMDPGRGTFGRGMRGPQGPRPMPPSNYMRQMMAPQQLQRGMGRGPMPRANVGQIQAPRPTFGQQMRPIAPGQRLSRRRARIIPRRR
jgi:hypothetical protein